MTCSQTKFTKYIPFTQSVTVMISSDWTIGSTYNVLPVMSTIEIVWNLDPKSCSLMVIVSKDGLG